MHAAASAKVADVLQLALCLNCACHGLLPIG
jgi:hypothetical protein